MSDSKSSSYKQFLKHKLLESRTLIISSDVNSKLAEDVLASLIYLDSVNTQLITLYINSPGGEVTSGLAIYDTIKAIKSQVKVINAGLCASIATIINCSVSQDYRFSYPHTKFLIHQPLIMGHIQGQASDLEIHAKDINNTKKLLNTILADSCKQDFKKVQKDTLRDYWMTADEAKKYGLISKIISNSSINKSKSKKLSATKSKK